MTKEKIDRINALGRLSQTRALTEEEKEEQSLLRAEYLREFRAALRGEASEQSHTKAPDK